MSGAMLDLLRVDLLQTMGAAPGTLAVLPPGESKAQKVVVGDPSGVVQCFSLKKGEVALSFKTLPTTQKVTSVCIGRGGKQRDKVFIAAGGTVTGVTAKGREFFRFTAPTTEPLRCLAVVERHLWAVCGQRLCAWVDGVDAGAYTSPGRINAAEVLPLGCGSIVEWGVALACQDKCIRVLSGGRVSGQPLFEVPTSSAPTALAFVNDTHDPLRRYPSARELLYGTEDGRVVQLLVGGAAVHQGLVLLAPDGPECLATSGQGGDSAQGSDAAPVTAILCGPDYSKSGCPDIAVAHGNGALVVWDVDPQGQPRQVFAACVKERITSLAGGCIASAASADLLLHTLGGKVILFTAAPGALSLGAGSAAADADAGSLGHPAGLADALGSRLQRMAAEVDKLSARVERERARYAAQSESLVAGAVPAELAHSLRLLPAQGCHCLAIDCATPLFTVALQATMPLQLLDTPLNVAILSRSPPDPASHSATLATYRCQDSTTHLSLKFRAREGVAGTVCVFALPALPPKTCHTVVLALPPLCLHERLPAGEGEAALRDGRPCSTLLLSGEFSFADVHGWVAATLPDAAAWAPAAATASGAWRHCTNGSVVVVGYQAGRAEFASDSLSSLATAHESVMRAATGAGARVSSRFQLAAGALEHELRRLWQPLEMARAAARAAPLVGVLQELRARQGGDQDAAYLSLEHRQQLDQADKAALAAHGVPAPPDDVAAASAAAAVAAAEDAVRQLAHTCARLAAGGGLGLGERLAALECVLLRKGSREDALAAITA